LMQAARGGGGAKREALACPQARCRARFARLSFALVCTSLEHSADSPIAALLLLQMRLLAKRSASTSRIWSGHPNCRSPEGIACDRVADRGRGGTERGIAQDQRRLVRRMDEANLDLRNLGEARRWGSRPFATDEPLNTRSIRTSSLRGLGAFANVFAIQPFMDELVKPKRRVIRI
jgi:hypothetical protein